MQGPTNTRAQSLSRVARICVEMMQAPETNIGPFVQGVAMASLSTEWVDVINPSTGQRLASIGSGAEADVDLAVQSSRKAFEAIWSREAPSFRKKALGNLADLIVRDAELLDALDAGEMGKPVALGLFNSVAGAKLVRFFAEAVDKITGDTFGSDANNFVTQFRVPRGVVGAIVPWNFPTFNAVLKLAPALAAGNTVVLKPSELASRSALHIARLAIAAGLPPGVVNVVPGLGATTGKALALHGDVDALTFTGSTAVGRLMLQYSGQSNMKTVISECGGKCPQIVFDDGIDLDAAAISIAQFLLTNQGQICSVGSRLLVQDSIAADITRRIVRMFETVRMGDASDPVTTFGPVVSKRQCARILDYIATAPNEGAALVAGGRQVRRESGGYFVEPTLFADVSPQARIAREEIFGPVLSVIRFRDEAEAIRIANSTTYGLAAYVWTASLGTALRVSKGIQSSVWVNSVAPLGEGASHALSFEPAGQSGVGTEGGLAGMESYMRRKVIAFNNA